MATWKKGNKRTPCASITSLTGVGGGWIHAVKRDELLCIWKEPVQAKAQEG